MVGVLETEPSSSAEASGLVGAYGLRLAGFEGAERFLMEASPDWPRYSLKNRVADVVRDEESVTDDRAELRLRNGGEILLDRADGVVEFVTPRRLEPAELVHPYLAPAAAVAARWADRESFHGGAFEADNGVWALLGEREGGKSSTLAWLVEKGHRIICDDMLVLDGVQPLAGPRALDLRAEPAELLGVGEYAGVLGARERWRVLLEAAPVGVPLRGWIFLDWGDPIQVTPVRPSERLWRLLQHVGLRLQPLRPERFLELADLPAWELRRPRGWDSLPEAAERLLDTVCS